MMKERYGLQNVLFVDDILTLDKAWLMSFLPEYRKHINVPFACFGHVNCIDEEMVEQMKRVAKWVKENGIKLMVDHTSGLSYESDYAHEMSIALSQETKADVIN